MSNRTRDVGFGLERAVEGDGKAVTARAGIAVVHVRPTSLYTKILWEESVRRDGFSTTDVDKLNVVILLISKR